MPFGSGWVQAGDCPRQKIEQKTDRIDRKQQGVNMKPSLKLTANLGLALNLKFTLNCGLSRPLWSALLALQLITQPLPGIASQPS